MRNSVRAALAGAVLVAASLTMTACDDRPCVDWGTTWVPVFHPTSNGGGYTTIQPVPTCLRYADPSPTPSH